MWVLRNSLLGLISWWLLEFRDAQGFNPTLVVSSKCTHRLLFSLLHDVVLDVRSCQRLSCFACLGTIALPLQTYALASAKLGAEPHLLKWGFGFVLDSGVLKVAKRFSVFD